jgi:hypothetical protein
MEPLSYACEVVHAPPLSAKANSAYNHAILAILLTVVPR